nr:allatostatin 1 [Periplaneta americana]
SPSGMQRLYGFGL